MQEVPDWLAVGDGSNGWHTGTQIPICQHRHGTGTRIKDRPGDTTDSLAVATDIGKIPVSHMMSNIEPLTSSRPPTSRSTCQRPLGPYVPQVAVMATQKTKTENL